MATASDGPIETLKPRSIPFPPPASRIGHYTNAGQALAALPGVVMFHWQVLYLGPQNLEKLEAALDKVRAGLEPGDQVDVNVWARASGEAILFQFVTVAGADTLTDPRDFVIGRVTVANEGRTFVPRVEPASPEVFDACMEAKLCSERAELNDLTFVAAHLNGVRGTTDGPRLIDLRDRTAKSGAAGRVILRADAGADSYFVFNVQTGGAETYPKKAAMKARGTTVWVLCKAAGREYTVVHNRLEEVEGGLAVSDTVRAGQRLGTYKETDAGVEIWRVNGAGSYFLEGDAFRVAPPQ